MTPYEVKAVAVALVSIVALMWVLSVIEYRWKRRGKRRLDSKSD